MSSNPHLVVALQRLRTEIEAVKAAGFVSKEFQMWHAAVAAGLLEALGEDGEEYEDFQRLQFELAPEIDESFSRQLEKVDVELSINRLEEMKKQQFQKAMTNAGELLDATIWYLKKS